MLSLFTIGYTKKSLRDFVERLKRAEVDCVVDVRLNNTSQLAGFSKRDDLEFLLEEGFAIRYIHIPELAPTEDLLGEYKRGKDWDAYVRRYGGLIEDRGMAQKFLKAADLGGWKRPCLLCSEDTPEKCHRRLLAEAVQCTVEGLEVKHL